MVLEVYKPDKLHIMCWLSYYSYTAEPSDLHEFADDKEPLHSILNGDLHHTHKQGNHTYSLYSLMSLYLPARVHNKRKEGEYSTLTIPGTNALRKVPSVTIEFSRFVLTP